VNKELTFVNLHKHQNYNLNIYLKQIQRLKDNTDTQYVIVQKGWTKHIVSRHLPLHNYELILWTIS